MVITVYLIVAEFWSVKVLGYDISPIRGWSLINVCIYVLLLAWVAFVIRTRQLSLPNSLNKFLLLSLAVGSLSVFVKILMDEVFIGNIVAEIMKVKNWANGVILYFLLYNILSTKRACQHAIGALLALLVVSLMGMILVRFGVVEFGKITVRHNGEASGFGNPNGYATFVVMLFPLLTTAFLVERRAYLKAGCAIALVLAAMGLLITGSRAGLIGLGAGLFVCLWLASGNGLYSRSIVIVGVVSVVLLGAAAYWLIPQDAQEHFQENADLSEAKDLEDYSHGRLDFWAVGAQLFLKSPVYGHGLDTFVELSGAEYGIYKAAHSRYLNYAVELGLVGLFGYSALMYGLVVQIYRRLKESGLRSSLALYSGFIGGVVAFSVALTFADGANVDIMFWIYAAAVCKYGRLEARESQNGSTKLTPTFNNVRLTR